VRAQRGVVIAAVLVVVTAALWVSVAAVARSGMQAAAIDAGAFAVQRRAAMRSGVLVIADQLFRQRDRMRSGLTPELDDQYVLWESGRHVMVCRVVSEDGEPAVHPEAAGLDLNVVTAERLGMISGAEWATARSRDRRIDAPREVMEWSGVDPVSFTAPGGPLDRLTVHGHEPNVQPSGDLRINIGQPWSDELKAQIEAQFGSQSAEGLEEIVADDPIESDGDIVRLLVFFAVPPEQWIKPLAVLTTNASPFRRGRVDLNTATVDVLATLPGVTPELASRLVSVRGTLEPESLGTVAWPWMESILTPDVAPDVIPLVTVGSWTWRVTLTCGETTGDDVEGALSDASTVECVIDVAGERPRIAMLRDITLRKAAVAWPGNPVGDEELEDSAPQEAPASEAEPADVESGPDPSPSEDRLGRWTSWRPIVTDRSRIKTA